MSSRSIIAIMSATLAWTSVTSCSKSEPTATRQTELSSRRCDDVVPHAAEIGCKENLANKAEVVVGQLSAQYFDVAKRLDAEYHTAFKGVETNDSFEAQARESQQAWAQYVKRQCEFEEGTSFGGSGGGDFGAECRLRLNNERADELRMALELASRQLDPK